MPTVPPVDYGWQSEKSILECHQHMLEEEVAADVTFIVGKKKQEVRAHKYMLICRSPVFHAMFCGPLAEDNNINIPDIEPDVFLVFLRFMYYDKRLLSDALVLPVLYAAKKYLVGGLVKVCKDYVADHIDVNNACVLLQGTLDLDVPEIRQMCFEFIIQNAQKCFVSESFSTLNDTCIKELIDSDALAADELTIWKSLVQWSDCKCEKLELTVNDDNRRYLLGDLVFSVRFRDMDPGVFAKNVSTSGILSFEEKCEIFQCHQHVTDSLKQFSSKAGRRCEEEMSRLIRFQSSQRGRWVGTEGVNQITFSVSKDIHLYGIVTYGVSCTCSIDVSLLESNFKFFCQKQEVTSTSSPNGNLSDVMFRERISIVKDKLYTVRLVNAAGFVAYGMDGKSAIVMNETCFKFYAAKGDFQSTSVSKGQIPGLLFKHK